MTSYNESIDMDGNKSINGIPIYYESDKIIAIRIVELEKRIEGLYDIIEELLKRMDQQ